MEFSKFFRSLTDNIGNLILIEFGRTSKLVKSSGFFRQGVDISGNLRLINPSGFSKFQFRARVAHYRAFLYIIRGSKQKLKAILINNHFV